MSDIVNVSKRPEIPELFSASKNTTELFPFWTVRRVLPISIQCIRKN